jgi:hypothetical protein
VDKRYQVFISSTYTDLKDERRAVYQTLMEMDCIPAGMELFPATDEEQWLFIQKIIDDSDYYVLILGGRYGSVTADGVSYTEKEFDYAISKGVKVVALIHGEPGKLPVEKSEMDPAVREKLEAFRNKAATGRLVKFWTGADQIPGLVATSLLKTMKTFPAVGWVRADKVTGSAELLAQLNELRIANDKLKAELETSKTADVVFPDDIASGDDLCKIEISNKFMVELNGKTEERDYLHIEIDKLFSDIGYLFLNGSNHRSVKAKIEKVVCDVLGLYDVTVLNKSYYAIVLHYEMLGLIRIHQNNIINLTDKGRKYLSKILVFRKPSTEDVPLADHAALQN